ncbi:4'-phosphopantetheinyl transferase superfamily protein [Streptomyces sp. NPDC094049]|uniref:4'-phosphopantetheinyl transferase family protein n=1 Tax=Streptomyces sp. NPDC094049 TaxID=3154987 RepID=UPI00332B8390
MTSALLGPRAPGTAARPVTVRLVEAETLAGWAGRLAPRLLDAGELRRAQELRRPGDRRNHLVSRVLLRTLLGDLLGIAPEAVRLGRDACPCCGGPHGRPVVLGGGAHFSLSHTGPLVLLGIGPVPLGVDVERVPDAATVAETASALHPREGAELAALDEASRPVAFARAWTRKEAYLKGIGTGLGRSAALDYLGTGPVPAAGPDGWAVADVSAPEGYAAAVATAADRFPGPSGAVRDRRKPANSPCPP